MFSGDMGKAKLNAELSQAEGRLAPYGRAERKAEKQAKKAEEAFRASKGYPPTTLWGRIKRWSKS